MSEKTKCPECNGNPEKVYTHFDRCVVVKCPICKGTGEVEPFWTREAPTEPGFYFTVSLGDQVDITEIRVMDSGWYWARCGIPFTEKLQPWQQWITHWSREPIRFPEPPQEEGDE